MVEGCVLQMYAYLPKLGFGSDGVFSQVFMFSIISEGECIMYLSFSPKVWVSRVKVYAAVCREARPASGFSRLF